MKTEPQVVRRPARFSRQTPAHMCSTLFAEDRDYILVDAKDKWAAVAMGIAVLIVVGLDSAWLMEWIK